MKKKRIVKKELLYDIADAAIQIENLYQRSEIAPIGSPEWDGLREKAIGDLLQAVRVAFGWPAQMSTESTGAFHPEESPDTEEETDE